MCGREPADRVKKSGEIRDSLERPGPLFLVVVTEGGTELLSLPSEAHHRGNS